MFTAGGMWMHTWRAPAVILANWSSKEAKLQPGKTLPKLRRACSVGLHPARLQKDQFQLLDRR